MAQHSKNNISDIIVLGSGLAGLYFALLASEFATVTVITKRKLSDSNTRYAQGGIAAVLDPLDNFKAHITDTMNAGAYLNDKAAVEVLVKEAPRHIQRLIELGVKFDQDQRDNHGLDLTREGGHSYRRIVHVHDCTGKAVEQALIHHVKIDHNIQLVEYYEGLELLQNKARTKVIGLQVLNTKTKRIENFYSKAVVLASGGCGQVYAHTTNPSVTTGDGIAMAQRICAKLRDMEFMQFHPTTLNLPGKPHFLLSESLRGEGAYLRNCKGQRFMHKYDKRNELAPRDIVSRAVYQESQRGSVYLDFTHKSKHYLRNRFPSIYQQLNNYGLQLDRDCIPITAVAHYMCGGVATDLHARTSVNNLYAIGEVARTGVHGANRLASNSLLECLVFAARASQDLQKQLPKITLLKNSISATQHRSAVTHTMRQLKKQVQAITWQYAGIVRKRADLKAGLAQLRTIQVQLVAMKKQGINQALQETINLCEVAIAIFAAALKRKVSVGAHWLQ